MKELSIEQKAKAYDEAIAKAAKIHRNYKGRVRAVDVVIEEVFPELKESEDENIRKKICKLLWDNVPYEEAQEYIAWLEKQGEKTPDKIVEKARTEKQRVLLTETDGNASIDWDCRSLDDVKTLLKCGLEFIRTIEANKQTLTDSRFGGCSFCVPTRYDKGIKQGEQKPTDVEEVDFFDDFRKTDSEVEPKFHINEWVVTDKNDVVQIKAVNNGYYTIDNGMDFSIPYVDRYWHKWTIQDAKPGDVLATLDHILIFEKLLPKDGGVSYCHYDFGCSTPQFNFNKDYNWYFGKEAKVYPATKEQRDLLFQKIHEAGYMWDSASKQLLSLKAEPIDEQKSVWSEEDDKILKSIIINIENLQFSEDMREKYHHIPNANKSYYQIKIDWLKSLKDRVLPQQKQEWNGEDESYYDAIIAKLEVTREDALLTDNEMDFLKSLEGRVFPKSTWNEEDDEHLERILKELGNQRQRPINSPYLDKIESDYNWLKSLRPQNRWKPSEEQMTQLKKYCPDNRPLTLLYEQLKKLVNEK